MEQRIYSSQFLTIDYDPDHKLIITHWIADDPDFTEDDFKKEIKEYVKAVGNHDTKALIIDTTKFKFPITPELDQWAVNYATPKLIEYGVKRVAYILPTDQLSKLSVELLINEAQIKSESKVIRAYFDNYEQGYNWVIDY